MVRGDLYTKQGILSMLQAGIKVEPLLMKDWSAVMDWAPHPEHKGEYLQVKNKHGILLIVLIVFWEIFKMSKNI